MTPQAVPGKACLSLLHSTHLVGYPERRLRVMLGEQVRVDETHTLRGGRFGRATEGRGRGDGARRHLCSSTSTSTNRGGSVLQNKVERAKRCDGDGGREQRSLSLSHRGPLNRTTKCVCVCVLACLLLVWRRPLFPPVSRASVPLPPPPLLPPGVLCWKGVGAHISGNRLDRPRTRPGHVPRPSFCLPCPALPMLRAA